MTTIELSRTCEIAQNRLQDGDSPMEVFTWLIGELRTFARGASSPKITQSLLILVTSRSLYENKFNEEISDLMNERVLEEDIIKNTDERVLLSTLTNADLSEAFDEGELQQDEIHELIREIISEKDLNISPERFQSLTYELSEALDHSYDKASRNLIENDEYGLMELFSSMEDAAKEENELLNTCLDFSTRIHSNRLGWP